MTSTFKRLPDSELFHVVLDLETLATASHSAITEIALVSIDGSVNQSKQIDPTTIPPQLLRDPGTIQWHEKRKPGYMEWLGVRGQDWAKAMRDVFSYLAELEDTVGKPICLWCQGTDFDIPILSWNLSQAGLTLPWAYCYVRDIRTIAGAYPEIKYEKGSHSALDDATKAAAHLRKIAFADPRIAQMLGIPHG